jgi:hypothetical protein
MFINTLYKSSKKSKIAKFMLVVFLFQLVSPLKTFALTGGPTQPEFQAFTPVGATDMVDLFTGDFSYNIPLMDVDGYPINLSYHNVSNADQESSWVGLGWNVNLGEIDHTVRGLPDDFKGEEIKKYYHVKDEKDNRLDLGLKLEIFGVNTSKIMKLMKKIADKNGKGGFKIGIYYGNNNYYGRYGGVSTGINVSGGGYGKSGLGVGVDLDFSSNEGADIGMSCNPCYATSCQKKDVYGMGLALSQGYNTRNGYKNIQISGNVTKYNSQEKQTYLYKYDKDKETEEAEGFETVNGGNPVGGSISCGLVNYVPTMTNQTKADAYSLGISVPGIKLPAGIWGTISGTFSHSVNKTEEFETRKGYGYLYSGYSSSDDLMDFVRDNGGVFSKNIPNLPLSVLTNDLYNVNAQGTGGSVRPYRNDNGIVHDPNVYEPNTSDNFGLGVGFGVPLIAQLECDLNYTNSQFESGLLSKDNMKHLINGNDLLSSQYLDSNNKFSGLYEPYYFKTQGEYAVNNDFSNAINGSNVYLTKSTIPKRNNSTREPRSSMVYTYNTKEAMTNDIAYIKKIENYTDTNGLKKGMNVVKNGILKNANQRKDHYISEITKISTKGERYVFGIPAMNNISKDVTMAVNQGLAYNPQTGLCIAPDIINSSNNSTPEGMGRDQLYSYSLTPAYAHSYLLSAILSPDYIDMMNDGITPDDIGNYVKFNYSLKDSDYRWRMPYSDTANKAYYEAGYNVDPGDNRVSYSVGSKELWYAHSIETKNMVAEFYTSKKEDGKGTDEKISNTNYNNATSNGKGSTYKLDSLKLYNRNDRFQNGENATPIKTIYFEYDYQLCKNTPNSSNANKGKLTLKRVYTKFGTSEKSLLSPYQFTYSDFNPDYNPATKNRWGTYQPINAQTPNYLFPYIDQKIPKTDADNYASAWQLTKIKLPTGGEIKVSYESDDYAFVQNKRASEMARVVGMGNSKNIASKSSILYADEKNPYDYIFVEKRGSTYFSNDLKKVFLDNGNLIYFNFAVDITHQNYNNKDNYDQVKGFAEILDIGVCPDDPTSLYIKIKNKELVNDKKNSKTKVNPISYAGINLAKKNLSRFLYPGGDNPTMEEMFLGLLGSLKELLNTLILVNPVKTMLKNSKAKNFDVNRSFVRLTSPDLKKKGGGCRVRRIELNDNWDKLIGGEPNSSFGNEYDYTREDATYGKISSGVASYEPQIGGDENSCKGIENYKIKNGSGFPRNEPLEDLQFTPLGETFYPSPSVGYSNVITKSIHSPYAYSAQAYVQNEFYTAKDFPVIIKESEMKVNKVWKPYVIRNENSWYGTQAYALILNDMHGKPKMVTNFAKRDPNATTKDLVSSIEYKYAQKANGELDNTVKTLNYNPSTGQYEIKTQTIGEEIDLTTDSRYSRQRTFTTGIEMNVNWDAPFIVIPTAFPKIQYDIKKFGSYVSTKLVQQYGVLKETIITSDKAKNYTRNEVYNPETGQPIVKSYNNEYGDREYESSYPSSWAYKGMSATYKNLFYTGKFDSVVVNGCKLGKVVLTEEQSSTLCAGDELLITCAGLQPFKVWMGDIQIGNTAVYDPVKNIYRDINVCIANVYPRTPLSASWNTNTKYQQVGFQVVRSGRKNQLESTIQQSVSMSSPVNGNSFTFTPAKLLSLNTSTYSNKNVISYFDTCSINPYTVGFWGNYRPANAYVFYKNREYTGHNRTEGIFNINSGADFWKVVPSICAPNLDPVGSSDSSVWKKAYREILYSPWGAEVQNTNALGIISSAQFGYAKQLPTAVASNVQNNAFMFDGFEDYKTIQPWNSLYEKVLNYNPSRFKESPFVNFQSITNQAPYYHYANGTTTIDNDAHTGKYSLKTTNPISLQLPINYQTANQNKICLLPLIKYIVSTWIKGTITNNLNITIGNTTTPFVAKTNTIDGWIKYEAVVQTSVSGTNATVAIPSNIQIDDFRIFPSKSNMKSFVYNDLNNRLMASLDENNFATFYEYDVEGTLLRTKKETEKGILTLQENRSSNKK